MTVQITTGQTIPSINNLKGDLLKKIERSASKYRAIKEDLQHLPVTLKVTMEYCLQDILLPANNHTSALVTLCS